MSWGNNQNNGIEFREIVLQHIKKILEISSHELRSQTYEVISTGHSDVRYQEDTRLSYIQAIENLAYVLLPYFDDDMKKVYKKSFIVINAYDYELRKYFEDEIIEICKETEKDEIPKSYFINKKVKYAKKLFCELNHLLYRIDYLKSAIYGEGSENEDDVEIVENEPSKYDKNEDEEDTESE